MIGEAEEEEEKEERVFVNVNKSEPPVLASLATGAFE
jgi:hypothetical protein